MRFIIVFVLLFCVFGLQAQKQSWNKNRIELMQKIVDKYHYAHYPIDTMSQRFLNTYIHIQSESNPIFTESEFEKYKAQGDQIFKESLTGNTEKLNTLYHNIMQRRSEIIAYLNDPKSWESQPQKGALLVKSKNQYYIGNTPQAVFENIKNRCYLDLLHASYDLCDVEGETLDQNCIQQKMQEMIAQYLKEKRGSQYFNDSLDMYESFCQAWISILDPHSEYQNLKAKQQFDESLSTKENDFGLYIYKNDENKFEVAAVIPGSAAWQSDKIQEGDEVRSIQFGNKSALKLYFMEDDEVNAELSKNADQILHLELRKVDGNIEKVDLRSSEIVNIDNLFQAYIFQNEYKIGYIALPSFYDSWDVKDASNSSANDLSKAIFKLNQDSADALILDLRYNGGGSMEQAIEIAGLFIDVGPVAIQRVTGYKAETLKDVKRGTLFDKPLIILTNEYSASASEFLASALQDLGRALIVGNKSYGKASMQVAIPVHEDVLATYFQPEKIKSDEYLHITIGKYYRITGQSLQNLGVLPDVLLPSYLTQISPSESKEKYTLSTDTVLKKTYYTPSKINGISTLKEKCQARLDTSNYIKQCKNFAIFLQDKYMDYKIPLSHTEFINYYKDVLTNVQKLENKNASFPIQNTTYDNQLFEKDPFSKRLNDNAIAKMKEDFFLNETICIMKDYLTLIK